MTCLDVQWIYYLTHPEDPKIKLSPETRNYLSHKNRPFLHLGYFPVDGLCKDDRLPRGFDKIISKIDIPVSYSMFTKRAVDRQLNTNIPMIHHGIDTNTFFPIDNAEAKRRLHIPENKFVVGMVATNQERKLFEDLIPAFAKFCKDKPDAALMLHTNPRNCNYYGCHDLLDLMDQYGILDKYLDTTKLAHCSDEVMNYLYNAIDVGVLCTQGEGFGLPIIHHHAAGKPVIATDCTSCSELTVHKVERIKTRASLIGHNNNIVRYLNDIDDLADKLETLYHNKELREKVGKMGMERVQKEFDYDTAIAPQWLTLLRDIQNRVSGMPVASPRKPGLAKAECGVS